MMDLPDFTTVFWIIMATWGALLAACFAAWSARRRNSVKVPAFILHSNPSEGCHECRHPSHKGRQCGVFWLYSRPDGSDRCKCGE